MIAFSVIHDIHGLSEFFNYHLQHISGIYGIPPVCKGCIQKEHIVNLMRDINFYCGKLRWTLIMTLLSWAFRRSIYYHFFFASGVCACSCLFQTHLGLSWTRYDVISVSAARLLVAAVAIFTAIHEENLWDTGPRRRFQQRISCGFVVVSRICQQQSLLANLAMFLLGIGNSWFSSPGYRKSVPAFLAMSFKSFAT